MEKTVLCQTILRRLDEQAAAGLDRETLEHLRSCPECRRELLAHLVAADSDAFLPTVPEIPVAEVIREGRGRAGRTRMIRQFVRFGAVAACCCLVAGGWYALLPRSTANAVSPQLSEWDTEEIMIQFSELDAGLTRAGRLLEEDFPFLNNGNDSENSTGKE